MTKKFQSEFFYSLQDFPEKYLYFVFDGFAGVLSFPYTTAVDGLFASALLPRKENPTGIILLSDLYLGVTSNATSKQVLQTFQDVQAVSNMLLLILNGSNTTNVELTLFHIFLC